jgi:hypothetical protein
LDAFERQAKRSETQISSRSFQPSAALAISVEMRRQVGLCRHCAGRRFSIKSRTSAKGRKLHVGQDGQGCGKWPDQRNDNDTDWMTFTSNRFGA